MKILIYGPGLIGRKHIDLCVKNNSIKSIYVVGTGGVEGRLHCDLLNIPYFNSLNDLLDVERDFDGVIVATPNEIHFEVVDSLANHCATFLVEKPLCITTDEYNKFKTLQKTKGLQILVGHHRLHNRILSRSKEIIDSGILGNIVGFTGSAAFYKPDHYFDDGPWRRQPGGGPISINLSHEIATIDYLLGEIQEVASIVSNQTRSFQVEDTVALSFRTEKNTIGNFFLSDTTVSPFSWEHTSGENNSYPHFDENCYTVYGTRGSLSIPEMRIYCQPNEQNWWKDVEISELTIEPRQDAYANQLEHFIELIKRNCTPLVSVSDSYRYFSALRKINGI